MHLSRYLIIFCCLIWASNNSAATKVKTAALKDIAIFLDYQVPATAVAIQSTHLSSQISGQIDSIYFEIGDTIKSGQPLLTLECESHRISKEQAEAGLNRLQANKALTVQQLDRAKQLVNARSISKDELDQRQTALDAINASIEEQAAILKGIENTIEKCSVKAPFSGIITDKMAQKGQFINPGAALAEIVNHKRVEIETSFNHLQVSDLPDSTEITFSQPDRQYQAKLRTRLPKVSSTTKNQLFRFSIVDKDKPVPGSLGVLKWQSNIARIPANLIVQRDKRYGVFLLQNKQAIFHPLQSVFEGQSVKTNLPLTTIIIKSPLNSLKHLDQVETD